jgi:hypothetical protein
MGRVRVARLRFLRLGLALAGVAALFAWIARIPPTDPVRDAMLEASNDPAEVRALAARLPRPDPARRGGGARRVEVAEDEPRLAAGTTPPRGPEVGVLVEIVVLVGGAFFVLYLLRSGPSAGRRARGDGVSTPV